MPVNTRRYYLYTEKDSNKISLKWKALHAFIFVLTAINAFCSAYAFQYILDSFNYKCVLYAIPSFHLKHIQYSNVTENTNSTRDRNTNSTLDRNISRNRMSMTRDKQNLFIKSHDIDETQRDAKFKFKLPKDLDVEVINGRYWVSNSSLKGQVLINRGQTVFSKWLMCNLVLFVSLITFVIAVFFVVIVLMFERGGRGYAWNIFPQSWLYVCPLLVISTLMIIINIPTASTVNDGLDTFCSYFAPYTGKERCSKLMNYFTVQRKFGNKHFYVMYMVCFFTYIIGVILWILQLLLTVLRILCVVDFQLHIMQVTIKKSDKAIDNFENKVQQALMKSYPEITEAKKTASMKKKRTSSIQRQREASQDTEKTTKV